MEGRPPGELGWGVRCESGVIPLGGLARIELGWPLCGCRHGGDPLAVGSGEAWLEEQEGGGGLGRGLGSRGLGSLGRIWGQEAESQCPTGEVETLKGPRSGDGVGGSLWGRGSPVRELGTGWGRGRGNTLYKHLEVFSSRESTVISQILKNDLTH